MSKNFESSFLFFTILNKCDTLSNYPTICYGPPLSLLLLIKSNQSIKTIFKLSKFTINLLFATIQYQSQFLFARRTAKFKYAHHYKLQSRQQHISINAISLSLSLSLSLLISWLSRPPTPQNKISLSTN